MRPDIGSGVMWFVLEFGVLGPPTQRADLGGLLLTVDLADIRLDRLTPYAGAR